MTARAASWIALLSLAAAGAATSEVACYLPSGPEPPGSGLKTWQGLYIYANSCDDTAAGQCLQVPPEMFDGGFLHPQANANIGNGPLKILLPPTYLARAESQKKWLFRRVTYTPPRGARLVWVKFVPTDKVKLVPVFTRLVNCECGPTLFIEPLPGG